MHRNLRAPEVEDTAQTLKEECNWGTRGTSTIVTQPTYETVSVNYTEFIVAVKTACLSCCVHRGGSAVDIIMGPVATWLCILKGVLSSNRGPLTYLSHNSALDTVYGSQKSADMGSDLCFATWNFPYVPGLFFLELLLTTQITFKITFLFVYTVCLINLKDRKCVIGTDIHRSRTMAQTRIRRLITELMSQLFI